MQNGTEYKKSAAFSENNLMTMNIRAETLMTRDQHNLYRNKSIARYEYLESGTKVIFMTHTIVTVCFAFAFEAKYF